MASAEYFLAHSVSFMREISGHLEEERRCDREEARRFNVFEVLGLEDKEVRTHSAFLAQLLDPIGSHGQGALFLEEFLHRVEVPNVGDLSKWRVRTEKYTPLFGNLDIVLSNYEDKLCIVIENKINARDQSGQLARYHRWLTSMGYPDFRGSLVYLTLRGDPPSKEVSLTIDGKYCAEAEQATRRMSYRKDISELLTTVLPRIEAVAVWEIVRQYIGLIERLS